MRLLTLGSAVVTTVLAVRAVRAAPCVELRGDPELVRDIGQLLVQRGVDLGTCPELQVSVSRTTAGVVIASDGGERRVSEPISAAIVLESWARTDVAEPLLAAHRLVLDAAPAITLAADRRAPRGVQVFAAVEDSLASDRTDWTGVGGGACMMVGRICVAGRARYAKVVDGPGPWQHELDRTGSELLVGGDVPLHIGRATVSPGFGGGVGLIDTRSDERDDHMHSMTPGLRADAHAALSYPLGNRLSLDLTFAVDMTEATHFQSMPAFALPNEPWLLARVGAGLRYGDL